MRLVGGSAPHEGRLEVYYNSTWGTVCDEGWDLQDATVVCRELGYFNASAAFGSARFGLGSCPILYNELSCTGNEKYISECAQRGTGVHNCSHSQDAGVVCEGKLVCRSVWCVFMHAGVVNDICKCMCLCSCTIIKLVLMYLYIIIPSMSIVRTMYVYVTACMPSVCNSKEQLVIVLLLSD